MFNKIKNTYAVVTVLLVSMFTAQASAALPAIVGTEITAMQVDALAAIDLVWPFLLAVIGGFIVMKIVKRGVNKV